MLAIKAAPGIATRWNGKRGLAAQTSRAAMPSATSGNCQTQAVTVQGLTFAQPERVNDERKRRQPEPDRGIR